MGLASTLARAVLGPNDRPSVETARITLPALSPRTKSESELHFDRLLPFAHQPFAAREQRLDAYQATLEKLRTERIDPKLGGNQIGSQVDLCRLSPEIPVLVVGDLHGDIDAFKRILLHADNLDRILKGECVLLLLGDLVHPERGNLGAMESSIRLHELYMELKTKAPHHVFALVGNHDPIYESVGKAILEDGQKTYYPQGELYRQQLDFAIIAGGGTGRDAANYTAKLSRCTELSPFFCVGDGFAAVHAGPTKNLTLEEMRAASPIDDPFDISEAHEMVRKPDLAESLAEEYPVETIHRLTAYKEFSWSRFESASSSNGPYYWQDVESFMRRVGQSGGTLIAGHTPPKNENLWCEFKAPTDASEGVISKHLVMVANRPDTQGYAVILDGSLSIQNLIIPANTASAA